MCVANMKICLCGSAIKYTVQIRYKCMNRDFEMLFLSQFIKTTTTGVFGCGYDVMELE